jgi:hypothetical protein
MNVEKMSAKSLLVGKTEGNRPLERRKRRRVDKIKTNSRELG